MTNQPPVLEIDRLAVQYRAGRRRPPKDAARQISLSVGHGETVAIVGESGSGKSTVGNAVLGLVPASSGSIRFDGEDITHATPRRRRELTRHIQAVFQDPYSSLNPMRTVGSTLTESLRVHERLTPAAARARAAAALQRVGLPADAAERYPARFSGGQRQRIAIARALILEPRLIVCDEPTSALDLSIQAQIINLLNQLQRELGISYLFITHDLAIIRHIAQRVVVFHRGYAVEAGPTEQLWRHPREPYTRALLAAAPVPDPAVQRLRRSEHLTSAEQS